MLSCKQATQLMSQAGDRRLGLRETLQLRLHLALCKACMNYRKQIEFIDRACRAWSGRDPD